MLQFAPSAWPPRKPWQGARRVWRRALMLLGALAMLLFPAEVLVMGRAPSRDDAGPQKAPAEVSPPRDGQPVPRTPSDLKPRMRPELAPDQPEDKDVRPRMRPEKADEPPPQPGR